MYGGDLGAGGGGGGGNWKAPDDPSLVVGGKDDVSISKVVLFNINIVNAVPKYRQIFEGIEKYSNKK